MSVQKSNSAALTIAGNIQQVLSGDGRGGGESMNWQNNPFIKNGNIDGWFEGIGTITRVGAQVDYDIYFGSSTANPLGVLGSGAFNDGYLPDGKYLFAYYIELISNSSPYPGASAVNLQVYLGASGAGGFLTFLSIPGDCIFSMAQNSSFAMDAAVPDLHVFLDSAPATIVFKILALYRTNQYMSP